MTGRDPNVARHAGQARGGAGTGTPMPAADDSVTIEGVRSRAVDNGRARLAILGTVFSACFAILAARMVDLAVFDQGGEPRLATNRIASLNTGRAEITDRNGAVMATNLTTASLYANPRRVLDAEEAALQLASLLPELDVDQVRQKLQSGRSFVWLKRNLMPSQQWEVNRLGLPGLAFQREQKRVYPQGRLAAHVLGFTDVDNNGIAGVEQHFDSELRDPAGSDSPVVLSIDMKVQHALRDELRSSVLEFKALGGAGMVMDVNSGEVLGMVSLPDFDPNNPAVATKQEKFNRATLGVYEMGSIFKTFTTAMALDAGAVDLRGGYDASSPIKVASYTINDSHPENRWLSVPEIFVHSSNIGSAKMALDVGTEGQRAFLERLGLLQPATLELPEVGKPLAPRTWREINTMTISYGHGIAVSGLQLSSGVAAMVNGGTLVRATLLRRDEFDRPIDQPNGRRVISEKTSQTMRSLLHMVVDQGTGKKARVSGYMVGGKTGTAEKYAIGGYQESALMSSFIGAFPSHAPRFLVLIMLDEPVGTADTYGFAGAGWTAAPAVSRIIRRIGPVLGVEPVNADDPKVRSIILAKE